MKIATTGASGQLGRLGWPTTSLKGSAAAALKAA